jgi:tetratricopeptide (TPR) repeat protein
MAAEFSCLSDRLSAAQAALEDARLLAVTFFPAGGPEVRNARLLKAVNTAVLALGPEPNPARGETLPLADRVQYFFLLGSAYNELDVPSKLAEAALLRAAKLAPANGEIWCALALCWLKLGALDDCHRALAHCGGPSYQQAATPLALRLWATYFRRLAAQSRDESLLVTAVDAAQVGVSKDPACGESWQELGMCLLARCFSSAAHAADASAAVKALGQAIKTLRHPSPDVHFNRGEMLRFLNNPAAALVEFDAAARLDPGLRPAVLAARALREQLTETAARVRTLLGGAHSVARRKFASLLAESSGCRLADLSQGANPPSRSLSLRVASVLSAPGALPVQVAAIDRAAEVCVVSLGELPPGLVVGAVVDISSPTLSSVAVIPRGDQSATAKNNRTVSYLQVLLSAPCSRCMRIGGRPVGAGSVAPAAVKFIA